MQTTSSIFTMADFKSELRKDQYKVLFAVTMPTEKTQTRNRTKMKVAKREPKLDPPGVTTFDFKGVHFSDPFLKHVSFARGSKTRTSRGWIRCLLGGPVLSPPNYRLQLRCSNIETHQRTNQDRVGNKGLEPPCPNSYEFQVPKNEPKLALWPTCLDQENIITYFPCMLMKESKACKRGEAWSRKARTLVARPWTLEQKTLQGRSRGRSRRSQGHGNLIKTMIKKGPVFNPFPSFWAPKKSHCFDSICAGLRLSRHLEAASKLAEVFCSNPRLTLFHLRSFFCRNFHQLVCLEACLKCFCSNFHGLATLEFETCIDVSPIVFHPLIFLGKCYTTEARTCEAWFELTFRPQKWNLKAHMWYQLSPFPSSNVAICDAAPPRQHSPILRYSALLRYSVTPCYVLIQVPNVIDTISKRWRSKKAFNTSLSHIFS